MTKVNWISIEESLPEHMQQVLAHTSNGHSYVVIFVLNEKVKETLKKTWIPRGT